MGLVVITKILNHSRALLTSRIRFIYTELNYTIKEIASIEVSIPGIFTEGEIIIGAHRDSLALNSAGDASSGSAILLEIARGMSRLLKHGWKPLRPIKLISWDGERSGLVGSTDYAEAHSAILRRRALVYLNLDNAVSGTSFHCKANPLLQDVIHEAAKLTEFNGHEDRTLYDHWKHDSNATISLLDGLSSYNSFQYHLGVPAANFQFSAMTPRAQFIIATPFSTSDLVRKVHQLRL